MANTAEIKAVITAEDKASSTIKGFADNTDAASSRIKNSLAIAGGAALAFFGKESVKAFEESQTALAQLDAVLKSTGGSAGITREKAISLSKEIERTTSLSDESALAVENMGLTFTSIHKDVFPDFTKAAIDVATALNHGVRPNTEQLVDVTKQLGKAYQDPDGSIGALHRMGVNTDELKGKLAGLHNITDKQRAITAELSKEFGGSATNQAKTFAGQTQQLKEKMNDLQEQVGNLIVKALKPLVQLFSDHPRVLQLTIDAVLILAAAFVTLKTASLIGDAMNAAKLAIKGVGGAAVATKNALIVMQETSSIPLIIPIAAALAALAAVYGAIQSVIGAYSAMNNAAKAQDSMNASTNQNIASLKDLIAHGTPAQQQRARTALKNYGLSVFASGVTDFEGGLAYVHQGELLVNMPKGTDVIPKNKVDQMSGPSSNITINVNAGAYMGSQVDARKYAIQIMKALQDAASAKNTTVGKMIGVSS